MKCPHCLESFFQKWDSLLPLDIEDRESHWQLRYCICPSCEKAIIQLGKRYLTSRSYGDWVLVLPKSISRSPLPREVPEQFANDYKEACLVLADSPKASAALSRRCLQNLLTEKAKTTKRDLADQIQEVIDSQKLPSYLSDALDAVRTIGNFAAHLIKSKSTGEIVEVEPGEAEWTLDTLEGLFDFYFVQPEIVAEKRRKLNKKLNDAGKPPLK